MEEDKNETVDSTNDTEVEETVEIPSTEITGETIEASEINVEQLQATNKKLYERAKKAEADLKALKGSTPQPRPAEAKAPPADVDERILAANGMSPELLKELKKIAKVLDTGLIEAQADPIFVAVKEKFEKEQKQKKASVSASRGSGNVVPKKDFTTPGLSREEHRKMVNSLSS